MPAVSEPENQLDDALKNRAVGHTRIRGVRVRQGEDASGEPALFVELILTNPPRELETWPVDDIWTLRRIVRDAVSRLELDVPWFIAFEPEVAEELEPEDTDEQIDLSADSGTD